ncbi:MAG: hypothetical protein IKU01_01505 [Bacteroidales bacterium]|nr:hypothetical protein [Bacteroidales bacterium]
MAFLKVKEGNSYNVCIQHFLIDSIDDLDEIEASFNPHFGDEAETISGEIYVRHSDDYEGNLWEQKQNSDTIIK